MILNELVSKLHSSTKVLLHKDGEDVELTPRILANCGKHEVLEIGIVGESMVDIGDHGEVEAKTTGEPEMTWLHVTLGGVAPSLLTGLGGLSGCGCKA